MPNSASAAHAPRRLPVELIIAAGCAIAILSFGPRSAIGAFQRDVLVDNNWTRDVFSIAIALLGYAFFMKSKRAFADVL